jgi:hypothetical protein
MRKNAAILFLLFVITLSYSCRKDEAITDASARLNFSTDSVLFDTVFTTLGSATKRLKIYNRNNDKIIISAIGLDNGVNSQFRINVDGVSGNIHTNVEIDGNDSLFIFLEVTIDPNNTLSPFVVNEKINFLTNGNLQSVQLTAWGQNAHYFVANKSVNGIPLVYLDKLNSTGALNVTWPNDKPYVIYGGYLTLDGDDKLSIDPGVRIHSHNNSGIWVFEDGNIQVNGTFSDPVIFQGTRLEFAWQDVPGQWDRIWINENTAGTDNVFNYAIIKNAFIGIQAEPNPFNPTALISPNRLRLNNCEIHNSSAIGLLARNYNITDTNSIISNSGQYNLLLRGGGDYRFNHTTIANYWTESSRETPSVFLQNYYQDGNGNLQVGDIDSAIFHNCIIHGNVDIEFDTDVLSPGSVNFKFVNSILKTTNSTAGTNFINVIVNPLAPIFINTFLNDYHLIGGSPAINSGFLSGVSFDHDGNPRGTPPDLGAYEE